MAERSHLSPFRTGLQGRCPRCGEGSLFDGYLKFAKSCIGCGESFEIEDAGDGPAVFVIFIVSFTIIPLALASHFGLGMPMWLTMLIWGTAIIVASLALLRPLRGIMFNLQWDREAQEIRNQDIEQD